MREDIGESGSEFGHVGQPSKAARCRADPKLVVATSLLVSIRQRTALQRAHVSAQMLESVQDFRICTNSSWTKSDCESKYHIIVTNVKNEHWRGPK